jgi:hypothetical protein
MPVISAIFAYFYFALRDPDRIQSEDWQLENQRILQGSKEDPFIAVTAQTIREQPFRIGPSGTPLLEAEIQDGNTPDEEPEKSGG